jgi:hypothetical protein
MNDHKDSLNEEWSAEDQARLAAMQTGRTPSPDLKRRTMTAARAAGFLRPKPRVRGVTLALVAAASLVFAAGALLGYELGRRATTPANAGSAANHEAVAAARAINIESDPKRQIIWY